MPRFGTIARKQQAAFRDTLSEQSQSPTDEKGRRHWHLLALGWEEENLFPGIRGPDGAARFFAERGIQWHNSARSGDRFVGGPTRNLASSQVCCVNFLLPLARVPGALDALLRAVDEDVEEVLPIDDGKGHKSKVEFEWVGDPPLEVGASSRGANQTSADALLVAELRNGRTRAYVIEWKYCEQYRRLHDLAEGCSGQTRLSRYRPGYQAPASSFSGDVQIEELMYDPFYQLMRMRLLADVMETKGVTGELPVDEARLLVICPESNQDYRRVFQRLPLAQRFPELDTVEQVFRACLKEPERFAVVSQERLVTALRTDPTHESIEPWLEYHELRYGW